MTFSVQLSALVHTSDAIEWRGIDIAHVLKPQLSLKRYWIEPGVLLVPSIYFDAGQMVHVSQGVGTVLDIEGRPHQMIFRVLDFVTFDDVEQAMT
jgi:hypothetical protein